MPPEKKGVVVAALPPRSAAAAAPRRQREQASTPRNWQPPEHVDRGFSEPEQAVGVELLVKNQQVALVSFPSMQFRAGVESRG